MPQYKLTYFNLTGLGEPVRFMLSYGGVNFEDIRYSMEEWPEHKADMPMGQIPVLEIDGKQYHQSKSLCRFLAKKFNVYGSDDYEALEIDAAADSVDDLRNAMASFFWNRDPAKKAELKEVTLREKLPFYLDKFEAQLQKNGGHFVGGKVSWADIYFTSISGYMSVMAEYDITRNHQNLKSLTEKILAHPNIKAYIEKRPKTQF